MINPYLNSPSVGQVQGQDLLTQLIVESIQAAGQELYYFRKDQIALDPLFRESVTNEYRKGWAIEMYQSDIVGFNGDGDLFSKFGVISTDQTTLQVSQIRFEQVAREQGDPDPKPLEDDVIYMPMSNTLWRIRKVKEDPEYFKLGKNYVWRLECVTYDPTNEKFQGDEFATTDFGEILGDEAVDKLSRVLGLKSTDQQNQVDVLDDAVQDGLSPEFDQDNPFGDC